MLGESGDGFIDVAQHNILVNDEFYGKRQYFSTVCYQCYSFSLN